MQTPDAYGCMRSMELLTDGLNGFPAGPDPILLHRLWTFRRVRTQAAAFFVLAPSYTRRISRFPAAAARQRADRRPRQKWRR